jgi:hypothetical protein
VTANAPSDLAVESKTAGRRGPVAAIVLLAVAWCVALGALVLLAANPIVVNRVQILHADVVAEGLWLPGKTPALDVQRVWKGTLPPGRIAVTGTLPEQKIVDSVIVPLSLDAAGPWRVTSGNLANPPLHPETGAVPLPATIRPVVYPATDEVRKQLWELLGSPPEPPAP